MERPQGIITKRHRLLEFYKDKKLADCTFNIQGTEIKAHKLILTFSSPVFEKMFFGDFPEDKIEISDIDLEDFEKVLKFIYIDTVDISSVQNAWNIYYAANKYFLEDLSEECLLYIKENICMNNLLLSYESAELYNVEDIKDKCFKHICHYFNGVISSDYHMKSSTLSAVLAKTIRHYNTFDLAVNLILWAAAECEIRKITVDPYSVIAILEEVNATRYMKGNWMLVSTCCFCDLTLLTCQCYDSIVHKTAIILESILMWEKITVPKNFIPPTCRFRQEYKMSGRADLTSDESFVISISVNCRMMIFGILVATPITPAAVIDKRSYVGSITGSVCEHNSHVNIVIPSRFEGLIDYDSEQYLLFRELPILEPNLCYDLRITYKNCDYSGVSGVRCHYMSKEVLNESNDFIHFFDEPFGTLVKGLSFYAA